MDARPSPAPADAARSAELARVIRGEIAASNGALDFSRFMALALYAPKLGYYSADSPKFGAAGDFVTAPELGPVFARCLARQCVEILRALPNAEILEAGAGSGALAADLLIELERLGALPERYRILELSAALRAHQQDTIVRRVPHLASRVQWLDRLPASFRGIVLGNELLDAMPVEQFRVTAHGIGQMQVGWENDRFVWKARAADASICARIAPLDLPTGYESEIGLVAEGWVRSIADILDAGVVLLMDYGFPRGEFYHPERTQGTLMCHTRHRAHGDPLVQVGLQDITAHVDFTAVADAATAGGLDVLGYTGHAMFLLGCGLDEIVQQSDARDTNSHARLTAEINRLTSPAEMGELFKVIALGRGLAQPLRGFRLQDRRGRLAAG